MFLHNCHFWSTILYITVGKPDSFIIFACRNGKTLKTLFFILWYVLSMTRNKSFSHLQLEVLKQRAEFENPMKGELERLDLGFKGENIFDEMIEPFKIMHQLIHIKDILFEYDEGKKEVQIDNIVIANDTCYIFEVKKYQFNLCIDDRGFFYYEDGNEFASLNTQVEKQRGEVRQLLKEIGYPMSIEHFIVFINPDRTVFGLQRKHKVLTRATLKDFLDQRMKPNRKDYTFLVPGIDERRLKISKHATFYEVNVDFLRKGVFCSACHHRMKRTSRYAYTCFNCNWKISTLDAVKLLIRDLRLLNPEHKINSNLLSKLSDGEISSSVIRKYRIKDKVKY